MNTIATIQGQPVWRITPENDGQKERVFFTGNADIDCDGSGGNPDGDPYFQPDTSLHHNGKALNSYKERFIVVPPVVCQKTKGVVLGCKARVHYLRRATYCDAVVGDTGPSSKVGELSVACAEKLGMDGNPNYGGEDRMDMVIYELWPDIPAVVDGVKYELQPY